MRSIIWTSVFFLALGCARAGDPSAPVADETESIIGGKDDVGDASVIALLGRQPGADSGFLCTGSVIAPTVILTAAHCVATVETGVGAQFVVVTSPDIEQPGARQLAVRAVYANPRWSPENLEGGHDQGIVLLAEPTSLRPLPFNRQPLSGSLIGKPVRIVGYGLDNGRLETGAGVKRQALTTLREMSASLLRVGDTRRGTCNGDSGGPAFMNVGGVETIVGTTSYGNAECTDGGFDARVDSDVAFIDRYLSSACAPACDGRSCGSDGCGGSCGTCAAAEMCSTEGRCLGTSTGCEGGGGEQEPNDSALQASGLCPGGTSRGTLASASDQDWFTWAVAADATYTVAISPASPEVALRVYKLASTGRLTFIGDGPTVARHTDAGGTYVARITTATAPSTPSPMQSPTPPPPQYTLNVHTTP